MLRCLGRDFYGEGGCSAHCCRVSSHDAVLGTAVGSGVWMGRVLIAYTKTAHGHGSLMVVIKLFLGSATEYTISGLQRGRTNSYINLKSYCGL